MEESDKRKLSPWMLERCLTQHLGSKPKTIRSRSRTTFSVEVSDVKQSKKMRGLTHLNNLPVAVDENLDYRIIKGLVYIYEYDMTGFELFKKGLIERCGIQDAVQATWMTPRNHFSKPIIVSSDNLSCHPILASNQKLRYMKSNLNLSCVGSVWIMVIV